MDLHQESALLWTAASTGVTFLCTAAGAAGVFFLKPGRSSARAETLSLGFAAGIMIAASVWSLILPAQEMAAAQGRLPWLTAAGGIAAGALFLKLLDALLPHQHMGASSPEGPKTKLRRAQLLFLAVTLHNIPEGGAIGLAAGMSALEGDPLAVSSALALAIGIGLQNVPEGAAVAIPLASQGVPRAKAFLFGAVSGAAEPVFGLIAAAAIEALLPAMPFMLAFAAGAMIYVVIEELVPASHLGDHSDAGTLAFIGGFIVMMVLDSALGQGL